MDTTAATTSTAPKVYPTFQSGGTLSGSNGGSGGSYGTGSGGGGWNGNNSCRWSAATKAKEALALKSFETDPVIPLREKKSSFDPDKDDVVFQLLDVTILRDEELTGEEIEHDESCGIVVNAVVSSTTDNIHGGAAGIRKNREVAVYLHGNLDSGETVVVKFRGYRPFFYLSLPETGDRSKDETWISCLLRSLNNAPQLPVDQVDSTRLVYRLPTTGFRNEELLPYLLFKFKTLHAFREYRNYLQDKFPPPTESQVRAGVYLNEVMICEAQIQSDIKFANYYSIKMSGWVKLSAGTYRLFDKTKSKTRAMHSFCTRCVEGLENKDDLADCLIDSVDIEAIRADGTLAMPVAADPDDHLACIGHAMESTRRSFERLYYQFTWGGAVEIPEYDRKGKPLPARKVVLKVYKTETEMLNYWVRWRRSQKVSPDCTIGWNIFGFDLGFLGTKLKILPGIDPDAREWGRLCGYDTPVQQTKIESKAIAFSQYYLTPTPGNVFLDSMIRFTRDVTLRLKSYHLGAVASVFLEGSEKDDVHFTEIKRLFFGNARDRGLLVAYNLQDCDLVLDLFFVVGEWAKTMNVCRVNRVPMTVLCTRGQQIRVYGGYQMQAFDNDHVMYRPHYHPILDEPIVEDPTLSSEQEEEKLDKANLGFECGNTKALEDYWAEQLSKLTRDEQPTISLVTVKQSSHADSSNCLSASSSSGSSSSSSDEEQQVRCKRHRVEGPEQDQRQQTSDDTPTTNQPEVDESDPIPLSDVPAVRRLLGMIPVEDADNVKVYGKHTNPFDKNNNNKKIKEEDSGSEQRAAAVDGDAAGEPTEKHLDDGVSQQSCAALSWVSPDGKSVEEIDRLSRVRRRKVVIEQATGPNKVVDYVGKNSKSKRKQQQGSSPPGEKARGAVVDTSSDDYLPGFGDDDDNNGKGFTGGFVMEPLLGFYENVAILDYNALYPNVMMSYSLDPALLVLDPRFARCPGVTYLKIRFNKHKEFLFAWGKKGVLILHTRNLVASRKVAQAVQGSYASRADSCRRNLISLSLNHSPSVVVDTEGSSSGTKSTPSYRDKFKLANSDKFEDVVKKSKAMLLQHDVPSSLPHVSSSSPVEQQNEKRSTTLLQRVVLKLIQEELCTARDFLGRGDIGVITDGKTVAAGSCSTTTFLLEGKTVTDHSVLRELIEFQSQSPFKQSQTVKEVCASSKKCLATYASLLGKELFADDERLRAEWGSLAAAEILLTTTSFLPEQKTALIKLLHQLPLASSGTTTGSDGSSSFQAGLHQHPFLSVPELRSILDIDTTSHLTASPVPRVSWSVIEKLSKLQLKPGWAGPPQVESSVEGLLIKQLSTLVKTVQGRCQECINNVKGLFSMAGPGFHAASAALLSPSSSAADKDQAVGDLLVVAQTSSSSSSSHCTEVGTATGGGDTREKKKRLNEYLYAVNTVLKLAVVFKGDEQNYNSKQNELKVGSNSNFGFVGAGGRVKFDENGRLKHKAMMQVMPVSATTCYIGRKTIECSKKIVEDEYPGSVVLKPDGTTERVDCSRVLYADTDSLFISFPRSVVPAGVEGLNKSFEVAAKIAAKITARFTDFPGSSMKIVHEKSARFLILYSAKCYALDKYEKPIPVDPGKIEIKGLSFSKRDCCKFVAKLMFACLELVLRHGQLEKAKQLAKDRLKDLVSDTLNAAECDSVKQYFSNSLELIFYASSSAAGKKNIRVVPPNVNPTRHQTVEEEEMSIKNKALFKKLEEALLNTETSEVETVDSLTTKMRRSFAQFLPVARQYDIDNCTRHTTFFDSLRVVPLERDVQKIVKENVLYERLSIYKKLSKQSYDHTGVGGASSTTSSNNKSAMSQMKPLVPEAMDTVFDYYDNEEQQWSSNAPTLQSKQPVSLHPTSPATTTTSTATITFEFPPGMPAHAQLAQVINQRKPNLGPRTGESVKYLYVDLGLSTLDKQNHRLLKKQHIKCGDGWIEDFDHVLQHTDLKPDKLWYLQNQCLKNICTVFKPLMQGEDPKVLLDEAIGCQKLQHYGVKEDVLSQMDRLFSCFGGQEEEDDPQRLQQHTPPSTETTTPPSTTSNQMEIDDEDLVML